MKRLWKIRILFHHFKSPLTHTKSENHIHHNCRKLPKKITFKTEDHLDSKRTRRKTRGENTKTSPRNPRKKMGKKTKAGKEASSGKNQGNLFRCLPTTVATMFEYLNKNPDKRALVDQMGFSALSHLPNKNLNQRLLKHLFDRYDIYDNTIYSDAAAVKITTKKIGDALGLSSNGTAYDTRVVRKKLSPEDQETHKFFQGKTTVALQNLIKSTPLDTDDNRKLFMRSFICFIQKVFLLPNSTANITPTALPTIFDLETIRSRNWALHVHNFLLQELKKAKQNKTVAIHDCIYVLMIIYFHDIHFGENSKEIEAQSSWLAY
ncbi:hypothetical protein PIB30_034345 [Stylosanthes scabra]|uniref:Uncharacterized protein n=1 Tax=Stylosanthes scabra TaxID=79078 RepID=A0ABU6UG40_9FABA|nr:hypothetical protein [Stylosanthes scabra]